MDYAHLGFMGNRIGKMPHLDRIADEGTVFTTAHVTMSRCRPSLASLLCGLYPHQSCIYCNYGHKPLAVSDTLPRLLGKAGYRSYCQGKFWEGDPKRIGFTDGPGQDLTLGRPLLTGVLKFLDEVGDQPFFLWYAPKLPHDPRDPPAELLRLFDEKAIPVPGHINPKKRESYQHEEAVSYALEAWLDNGIGQIMAKLRQRGLDNKTMVVFLLDNGWANGHVSKGSPFERGLRTPIVLRLPGVVQAGRRVDSLTSALDVVPTLLDYAGVQVPAACAGHSLRGMIEGKRAELRDTLFGAVYPANMLNPTGGPEENVYGLYLRTARWKYVLYLRDLRIQENTTLRIQSSFTRYPKRNKGDQDLFDLSIDPDERNNLAGLPEHRATLESYRKRVIEWWRETGGKALQ